MFYISLILYCNYVSFTPKHNSDLQIFIATKMRSIISNKIQAANIAKIFHFSCHKSNDSVLNFIFLSLWIQPWIIFYYQLWLVDPVNLCARTDLNVSKCVRDVTVLLTVPIARTRQVVVSDHFGVMFSTNLLTQSSFCNPFIPQYLNLFEWMNSSVLCLTWTKSRNIGKKGLCCYQVSRFLLRFLKSYSNFICFMFAVI